MDLPDELLPNKDRQDRNASITCSERLEVKPNVNLSKTNDTPSLNTTTTTYSLVTQAATSTSRSSTGQSLLKHSSSIAQQHHGITPIQQSIRLAASTLLPQQSIAEMGSSSSLYQSHHIATGQQNLEKLSRPAAFDKMESLVREMQDPEHGVPVRQQKMFLTSIPYAFMGYDLIEWLMDRLLIEESEALNIANQLCLHGYFFPVNDTKMLTVKDDSSLYRFQTPYYWPWQHKPPDNVEYAIYLVKRSMRNKQRHALEDYELEALASLHKNLKGKWEIIKMQAEEQVRLAKERKKGDKIVGDSQERAYWRVYRPPPGQFTPLEPAPVPSRDRQGTKQNKKKLVEDLQREINYLRKSLTRTRIKMSQACESLVIYSETFAEYDFFLQPVLPSNPWVTEDITFWQLNNNFVDIPTEKRVKRWAISIEELVSDPTGLQEFTTFLEKEYSHENIRFWLAVNRLRRSAHSQVPRKVQEIYEEFLKPGAPCEINIDGKTMENVLKGLKHPSRFTFDAASEHIYTLLLKKDCYPRFIRSDHYKRLLETGIQPAHKKRFFNFGGVGGVKKKITTTPSSQGIMSGYDGNKTLCNMGAAIVMQTPNPGNLSRRRSSDRSLSGSAHELTAIDVSKDSTTKVPHSHSQSNLSELPFGEPQKSLSIRLDSVNDSDVTNSAVCPWDAADSETKIFSTATGKASIQLSICPWEQKTEISHNISRGNIQRLTSTSSDNSEINERTQRNLVMRHQHTVDSGDTVEKRLAPNLIEPRRASVSFTPRRKSEYSMGLSPSTSKVATTPSPTISTSHMAKYSALFKPLQVAQSATAVAAILGNVTNTGTNITKDPPSNSDTEMEELSKLSLSERSESSSSDLPVLPTTAPAPTPLLLTKITPPPPPPPPPFDEEDETLEISVESQPHATTEIKYIISQNSSPQDDVTTKDSSINVEKNLETEVDVKIDEVQIELIETNITDYKKLCEGEDPSILETNTVTHIIHIEEDKKNNAPALNVETLEETISTNAKLNVKEYDNEKLQEEVETTNTETASKQSKEEITVEFYGCTEDLSPTTDEFRETSQFGIDKEVCGYDLGINTTGYIPPAPTPAPVMAPLAEIDTDIVDDEGNEEMATCKESSPLPTFKLPLCSITKYQSEETRRRRKKKHIDSKKLSSMEENDVEQRKESEASTSSGIASKNSGAKSDETDIITVCPWEDENISTSDGTFVKTYATLGYL